MPPSADDVRHELDRLLGSAGFANAGRMSRFLKFVVEQTLAGEGERLKEYVIGVEVFDRDADYDPRLDAIVRVEATRLRTKLSEYYAGEGRGAAVVLSLPKGGYAPVMKRVDDAAAPNSPRSPSPAVSVTAPAMGWVQPRLRSPRGWLLGILLAGAGTLAVAAWAPWTAPTPERNELRVAVLPFTPYPGGAGDEAEAVAIRLTEGVTAALVRADRFAVVASSAARAAYMTPGRLRDVAAALDADVLIEARVMTDGEHVSVEARAANGPLEQKVWVETFAGNATDSDALEREIAAAVAVALSEQPGRD